MAEPKGRIEGSDVSLDLLAAIFANLLTIATLAFAWFLLRSHTDLYYRTVQEDQTLEWASFVAFLVAALFFAVAAVRQRRATAVLPWFLSGVALFCFVVAMEEISWAQRVFAYRPPVYFLENNFQQEFNLHNVVDIGYRRLAIKIILVGYGVVLPLAALYPPLRRLLAKVSIIAPPVSLAPLFLVSYFAYAEYAWKFTGEWIELMMGLGFLFAALPPLQAWRIGATQASGNRQRATVVLLWLAIILCGALLAFASDRLRGHNPELIEAARTESNALRLDFLDLDKVRHGKRHINKRIYSYVDRYDEEDLYSGAFAALVGQGLPEDRARFFLDPWNSPYWVQCTRDGERRFYYVYSFGPNRRRESSKWEILGDDIGAVFDNRGQG